MADLPLSNEQPVVSKTEGVSVGVLGSRENPYRFAPPKWNTEGVPYGAFCCCYKCGGINRSTITFDYYANISGEPLECENCRMNASIDGDAVDRMVERAEGIKMDPLGPGCRGG